LLDHPFRVKSWVRGCITLDLDEDGRVPNGGVVT
jgi:hypothetical protein